MSSVQTLVDGSGSTTQFIVEPVWDGSKFTTPFADDCWKVFPDILKNIVLLEIESENEIEQILRNNERHIVLIALKKLPKTREPSSNSIKIHRAHSSGNYCYDGTYCTYEELVTGCFISFEDPDYDHEAFL